MILKFEELNELFEAIDRELNKETHIYIIGGAALLHHGVGKGYTKDIDVVFSNEEQLESFRNALTKIGFVVRHAPIGHDKLEIFEMLEKEEFRFDLFLKTVIRGYSLSGEMVERSENNLDLKYLKVHICSKEDIVIFKSLSPDRPGDVEDSVDLIKRGIDWKTIYEELLVQVNICKDAKKKKELLFWFINRVHDLEKKGVSIPIKGKVMEHYDSI